MIRATIALMLCLGAAAARAQAPAPLDYSQPGTLADVGGGRHINLRCAGSGGPTVVLIAGLGNSAVVWDKVQPGIAQTARVCAWDRAGFGFSDGSRQPQTAIERTMDLERALRAAHLAGPYVLVGHSLGSYESFVFADRNRGEVAGMVLVDPSLPDEARRLAAKAPAAGAYVRKAHAAALDLVAQCTARIRAGSLKAGGPDPDGCFQYPPYYPPDLQKRLAKLDSNPLRAATHLSYYQHGTDSADAFSPAVVNPRRNYGDMPLIVLSSDAAFKPPPGAPPRAVAEQAATLAEWRKAHEEFAHLSTRGIHSVVAGSQHAIQRSNPGVVIEAVALVIAAARKP